MLFINNHWLAGEGKRLISTNPLTLEELWNDNQASKAQVNEAITSASNAFIAWRNFPLRQRIIIIKKFYKILSDEKEFLANLISQETGKLLSDAASEVSAALAKLNNSLKAYKGRTGSTSIISSSSQQVLEHFPHGPMAVIGPFNFPLHLPNGHITPALIACLLYTSPSPRD